MKDLMSVSEVSNKVMTLIEESYLPKDISNQITWLLLSAKEGIDKEEISDNQFAAMSSIATRMFEVSTNHKEFDRVLGEMLKYDSEGLPFGVKPKYADKTADNNINCPTVRDLEQVVKVLTALDNPNEKFKVNLLMDFLLTKGDKPIPDTIKIMCQFYMTKYL